MERQSAVRIGLMSRLDFGSEGARNGLVKTAYDIFFGEEKYGEPEAVHFMVIAGGLVDCRAILRKIKENAEAQLKRERNLPRNERRSKAEIYASCFDETVKDWAKVINGVIPQRNRPDGSPIKTYIVTSSYYDGEIGRAIAELLAQERDDIFYEREGWAILPLKQIEKRLAVLVPSKAPWRGRYYSTPVQREAEDFPRASVRGADFYVVGCVGSSVHKPAGGESDVTVISVPVLSSIEGVKTSENQVGVLVIEVDPENPIPTKRTYSLKDALMFERDNIRVPAEAPEMVRRVVKTLQDRRDGMTSGMLADVLGCGKEEVESAVEWIESNLKGQFKRRSGSRRLDFNQRYLQRQVRHRLLPVRSGGEVREDRAISFGCLHALDINQARMFFSKRVPEIILQTGATIVLDAGDNILGLAHNLDKKGQIVGGAGYTKQEQFAAGQIARLIRDVFKVRFSEARTKLGDKDAYSPAELEAAARGALLRFWYIPGNHDEWVAHDGYIPLATFDAELRIRLEDFLSAELAKYGLFLPLRAILNDHVVRLSHEWKNSFRSGVFTLPSGVTAEMLHPHMGRALTWSLRAQQTLGFSRAQVVVSANYHVGITFEEWEPERGQRLAQQVGTIVLGTPFEDGKLKKVDTHVGYFRIVSIPDPEDPSSRRIFMSETTFFAPAPEDCTGFDNDTIFRALEKELEG